MESHRVVMVMKHSETDNKVNIYINVHGAIDGITIIGTAGYFY